MAPRRSAREARPERRPTPAEWTRLSRIAQGLPSVVTDPATLANVEALVCRALGFAYWRLAAPDGTEPAGIGVAPSAHAIDNDVVKEVPEDGALPLQGE